MSWLDTPKSEHVVRREHYVTGRQDERERIIALLEEASEKWRDTDYDAHYGAEACLALIKGENK